VAAGRGNWPVVVWQCRVYATDEQRRRRRLLAAAGDTQRVASGSFSLFGFLPPARTATVLSAITVPLFTATGAVKWGDITTTKLPIDTRVGVWWGGRFDEDS